MPEIPETATRAPGHIPAVAQRVEDGHWGVYCLACSDAAGDYVYPCRVRGDSGDWPPQVLADPAVVRRAYFAEPFGTPEEIAAREARPRTSDDPIELCERIRPGLHEQRVRAKVSEEIEAEKVGCKDHPMPFPRPSCWTCARDGAFHRSAHIARGEHP